MGGGRQQDTHSPRGTHPLGSRPAVEPWGAVERETERERTCAHMGERERALWLLFLYIFFLPPGPALCKLGLGRSAVLSEVLTPVLGLSLTFLCSVFVGFPLPCLLATAILDSFSLPNKMNGGCRGWGRILKENRARVWTGTIVRGLFQCEWSQKASVRT